jgi:hypothetical protein
VATVSITQLLVFKTDETKESWQAKKTEYLGFNEIEVRDISNEYFLPDNLEELIIGTSRITTYLLNWREFHEFRRLEESPWTWFVAGTPTFFSLVNLNLGGKPRSL